MAAWSGLLAAKRDEHEHDDRHEAFFHRHAEDGRLDVGRRPARERHADNRAVIIFQRQIVAVVRFAADHDVRVEIRFAAEHGLCDRVGDVFADLVLDGRSCARLSVNQRVLDVRVRFERVHLFRKFRLDVFAAFVEIAVLERPIAVVFICHLARELRRGDVQFFLRHVVDHAAR